MEEVTTPETIASGGDVAPVDGEGADQTGNISLDVLKETLGKEFKDPETALKSIKDTYNYVGDVGKVKNLVAEAKQRLGVQDDAAVIGALEKLMSDEIPTTPQEMKTEAPTQSNENFVSRDQYLEDMFFSKNEALSDVRDVLTPLKNASAETKAMDWQSFIATEQAKKVVDTFVGYKEVQASKSVLESNPRLGTASDKLSQARTLVNEARQAGMTGDVYTQNQALNAAKESAVDSVLEAYDLK